MSAGVLAGCLMMAWAAAPGVGEGAFPPQSQPGAGTLPSVEQTSVAPDQQLAFHGLSRAHRWPVSTAVRLWTTLAGAALALAGALGGVALVMLGTALGLQVGFTPITLGTDLLLGFSALCGLGAATAVVVALSAGTVGGVWFLADLLSGL